MSAETKWLALRLEGPLQSWGLDSQYNIRGTGLMPTKSAVAGICGAAIGLSRNSEESKQFHSDFSKLKMMTIVIPRKIRENILETKRMQDYHIVQGTRKADGKIKPSHITYRQYLNDTSFGVILFGDKNLIQKITTALEDPFWFLWLGRKSCVPSSPILVGSFYSKDEALTSLIKEQSIEEFIHQEEVDNFADGNDSLPDQTSTSYRSFVLRRVKLTQAKI